MFGEQTTLYVGVGFLASAADVKVSYPSPDVSPEYAYLFLSPHFEVNVNSTHCSRGCRSEVDTRTLARRQRRMEM